MPLITKFNLNEWLPLPEKFDLNEWFSIITLFVGFSLIIWLPKRLPSIISFLMFMFGLAISRLLDHIIGSKGAFDAYDVLDSGKFELFDLLTYPIYGISAYLFIYMYDKLQIKKISNAIIYIGISSLFGILFEYIGLNCRFFTYKGWHLYYSLIVYLLVQPLTLWFYHYVSKQYYNSSK